MSLTASSSVELIVRARERDIGGFQVRRILPYATHRMVGPFIFFDHMGPAVFESGQGMDVRPHPHIGLSTVTYLFEGKIRHRDSLGSDLVIEPGAINWMTAGRGIVHSERSPEDLRKSGFRMNGIQCWVALPHEHEEVDPAFSHHPSESLPRFEYQGVQMKLLVGSALGHRSPVPTHSDLFYLESHLKPGQKFTFPSEGRESAVYLVTGELRIDGETLNDCSMAIAKKGMDLTIEVLKPSHVLFLGGEPVGHRFIWWNLVSSSESRIQQAKIEWALGPQATSRNFPIIPNDNEEFIPLPKEPPTSGNPKGTIM